ncbi:hypothetical protein Tco_1247762 [Tanacetum coccineum]
MSSPNRSTSDIKDAFSSMNILNYTSVSSNYFPASSGIISFNSSENSTDNMIPPVFSSFYNNPYLKDVQAFYAKESPISSPDPITPPAILTPSPVLPPSLLFDPRYFFVPEELLPPKKQIRSPSSSSTTLFNSSRNQTCNLVSPSSLVYTPTPPQVFEIEKCSDKMYLKHHEKQVEDILNYLDELYLHRIERMEEGRINGNELKTELKEYHVIRLSQLQKKRVRVRGIRLPFAHYRISILKESLRKSSSMPPKRTSTSNTSHNFGCHPATDCNFTEPWIALNAAGKRAVGPYSLGLNANDSVFSRSRCQANRTTWTELKRLLTNKYCPRTEIRKIAEELYNGSVMGNDLKPYVRRFQDLTTLCPNMVPKTYEETLGSFYQSSARSIEERYCLETSNFGGSHQHIPEVNGSDNKTRFCARNQVIH